MADLFEKLHPDASKHGDDRHEKARPFCPSHCLACTNLAPEVDVVREKLDVQMGVRHAGYQNTGRRKTHAAPIANGAHGVPNGVERNRHVVHAESWLGVEAIRNHDVAF